MESPVTYMTSNGKAHTNGHTAPAADIVPAAWLRFLYRMAGLERGRVYTITLIVPDKAQAEPMWTVDATRQLENGHRV